VQKNVLISETTLNLWTRGSEKEFI